MKKFVSTALLFTFAFFAFTSASAQESKPETQEKKITDAEFKAVQKKSADKTNGKSYRVKTSSKTYKTGGALSRFFNETTEYVSPDSSRTVIESGGADGKIGGTSEIIKIGQKAYNRTNNGTWSESAANASANTITASGEHIYKGKVEINEQTADLYESKYVSKTIKGGRDFITTTILKSWFGKDGVLLRTEEEIETNNTITKKTSEYEYDPNIKIEAPIK